jgi:magnesium chelatase family protein
MDLLVGVERPAEAELRGGATVTSREARDRVLQARARQRSRLIGTTAACNGELDAGGVRRFVRLDSEADGALARAYAAGTLSARGRHRVLRVAQTVADLRGAARVAHADVLLALSLRQRTAGEEILAA